MDNKGLLIIIIVLLVGVIGVLVIQDRERAKTPGEKIANAVSETFEEAADEIDDHTDAK